jgi:hypothetical protein
MTDASSYLYFLILPNEQRLGPYDRRTLVGMRMKKAVDKNASLLRNDGYTMTMAQLLADRTETAGQFKPSEPGTAEQPWPSYAVDCGGSFLRGGVLGFQGLGELRFTGDKLRINGQRKGAWLGTKEDRVKIPLSHIAWARAVSPDAGADAEDASVLELGLIMPVEGTSAMSLALPLADAQAVTEMLALLDKPAT